MNEQILNYIGIAGIAVLTALAGAVIVFVKSKIEQAKLESNKIKNESLKEFTNITLDRLRDLIVDTVDVTNKELGDGIRELIKDGKASKDELEELTPMVIKQIKNQLGDKYKEALADEIGDLDLYLTNQVKLVVEALKNDK